METSKGRHTYFCDNCSEGVTIGELFVCDIKECASKNCIYCVEDFEKSGNLNVILSYHEGNSMRCISCQVRRGRKKLTK